MIVVSEETLQQVVDTIVHAVHPRQIILFGLRAWRELEAGTQAKSHA